MRVCYRLIVPAPRYVHLTCVCLWRGEGERGRERGREGEVVVVVVAVGAYVWIGTHISVEARGQPWLSFLLYGPL